MLGIKKRRGFWMAALFIAFMLVLAGADGAQAGRYERKSQEHHDNCNAWCAQHSDICTHCSKRLNCGKGYETIQSWTGYGKNWYACKRRLSRDEMTAAKSEECRAWCERNPDCRSCVRTLCPHDLRTMKVWAGRGDNYRACGKKQYRSAASNRNQADCWRWCRENRDICNNCSTNKNCGAFDESVKSWKGKGRNWHACTKRSTIKARNQADCEAYCAEHPDECVECKVNKGCGSGLTAMKSFRLGNNSLLDYHACKRRQSRSGDLSSSD